jgi:hypothetical protein
MAPRLRSLGQAGHVLEDRLDLLGVPQAQPDEREPVEVGPDGIGVDPPLLARDQLLHDAAHVALVEDRGTPAEPARHQLVAPGVQRLDPRAQAGQPCRHLLPGLAVVGHGKGGAGLVGPVLDQVPQPLGEHPGLARAGRCDDPGRTGTVGHRRELVGGERGRRRHRSGLGSQRARLDRLAVHHGTAADRHRQRTAGATVDPGRAAVGQDDVTGLVGSGRRGAAPLRLRGPPPHGLAQPVAAGVVGVGPDQEVQPVEPRLDLRAEGPGLPPVPDRLTEPGRVDSQRHHHRLAVGPGPVQGAHDLGRIREGGLVDGDDRRRRPRCGWSVAGQHDDPTSELGGSGYGHAATLRAAYDT